MTALLGRRGDAEPTTCLVCGRLAWGIGVAPSEKKPIGWLCKAPDCIELGLRIYVMQSKELSRLETMAIDNASQHIASDVLECVLGALWDSGIRSLDALDAAAVTNVREKMQAAPEYKRALGEGLTAYGAAIKRLVDAGEPPF